MCLFWCQQIGQVKKSEKSKGTVTNLVFFSKTRYSTYILPFIFLTVQDGSLQRCMVCLLEFVVKSAVTKYVIKNYISKSIVVSINNVKRPDTSFVVEYMNVQKALFFVVHNYCNVDLIGFNNFLKYMSSVYYSIPFIDDKLI